MALKGLEARLKEIHAYLELVVDGRLPLNHEILYHLQVSSYQLVGTLNVFNCSILLSDMGNDSLHKVRICSVFEDTVAKELLLYSIQDVFNLLPNLNVHELVKSFAGEFQILSAHQTVVDKLASISYFVLYLIMSAMAVALGSFFLISFKNPARAMVIYRWHNYSLFFKVQT